ncbi:MAG: hypothetical protein JWO09_3373 [Bacteroidetes bacterium]|nr:hypothetical protein [Bacteroidota bacterium]
MIHTYRFNYYLLFFLSASVLSGCMNYRKLLTDEVVLKDGNSQTGTILKCDSVILKIKQIDESIRIIPWTAVDTVQGKKLKTLWLGANLGYYKAPYFSVFRNTPEAAEGIGFQLKAGIALRGTNLYYLHLEHIPGRPYPVTKYGFGWQHYLGQSTYIRKNTFFTGAELNLLNAKFNNGPQLTLEPFTGYERRLNQQLRIHFKFGLQFNLANKNSQAGVNLTVGLHFMKRNFKKYYETLNREHRLPRK